ncbi:hypothetical protein BKA70DRAFT_1072848, partial [Coprinopsis sp. MPI-PUGE-AT-0042]
PVPVDKRDIVEMLSEYCSELAPDAIEEAGCMVCGQLVRRADLSTVGDMDLACLEERTLNVSRTTRTTSEQQIERLHGPIVDPDAQGICSDCLKEVKQGRRPKYALANGFWLGQIPTELQGLTMAEQLLIARLRRNRCIIRVSNGQCKMAANVIAFDMPMVKIYN